MDKFTIRGIIYSGISLLGIGYEVFFSAHIRPLLIILYSFVIVIGLICIFYIKEEPG
ncbi:MAG: hypothetical protein ONB05_00035 [candidate division KSB1 bacterium]|nr:hypothetical protein [candidate division KSB1 bacterium]